MALNLADRIAVLPVIRPRCTAAVANYALYILGDVNATVQKQAWAREAIRQPAAFGEQVSWHILNQQGYIDGGSSISDGELSGACEAAINAHFIAAA